MSTLFSSTTLEYSSPTPSFSTVRSTAKRLKLHHHHHLHHQEPEEELHDHDHDHDQDQCLLPGLPDHISHLILSSVPPSTLYTVCRSWRSLIYSPSFPPFLSLYALFHPSSSNSNSNSNSLLFSSFDPISSTWHSLPPPPLTFLFHHPSFISRKLPLQSVSASNRLILLAATAQHFTPALSRPLLFNPLSKTWSHGPPLSTPRRWCAAGSSNGVVYVASGVGSHYNTDVARSLEKWDLKMGIQKWEKMAGSLKDGKFSREAIEAVGWRGKLCMVNVKGYAAKEGIIYDVEKDTWTEMPEGMLGGWRGPAASMDEETIYGVDELRGCLKKYDHVRDTWIEVVVHGLLKGAMQVVAAKGRVCVLCGGGAQIAVVDVAGEDPGRVWVVDAPPGLQAVAVHVLPRLSLSPEP